MVLFFIFVSYPSSSLTIKCSRCFLMFLSWRYFCHQHHNQHRGLMHVLCSNGSLINTNISCIHSLPHINSIIISINGSYRNELLYFKNGKQETNSKKKCAFQNHCFVNIPVINTQYCNGQDRRKDRQNWWLSFIVFVKYFLCFHKIVL